MYVSLISPSLTLNLATDLVAKGDTVPLQIVSMLEAPLAIIALSGPPINQIMRRAKLFGWHSLFSTAREPSRSIKSGSGSEASGSVSSEGKSSRFFSRVVRKKESSASILPTRASERDDEKALHPMPLVRVWSDGANEERA
jgi:hypothetical protein